ncbi:MAG: pseudouridine synthase [bacterium]
MPKRERKNPRDDRSKRKDPLIGPGGKVDPGALFRAAKAAGTAAPPNSRTAAPHHPAAVAPPMPPAELAQTDADLGDDDVVPVQSAARQRVLFTLQKDLDKRLDKYLVDRITFMSRAKLQQLIDDGGVRVNDRLAKASTNLRLGDVVEVMIEAPPAEDVPPEDIPLDVLFEDEHIIVLNKSADIIVHPARSHLSGTLINALAFHFRHRSGTGGALSAVGKEFARPGVVHRLDRQTSGAIIFAKTDQAHWKLGHQFEHRQTDKRYVAFVHGYVEPPIDAIDEPIGPHPSREKGHREKQVIRHDHLGKDALTIYRVLGRYCSAPARGLGKHDLAGPKPALVKGWASTPPQAVALRAAIAPQATPSADRPGPLLSADSPWVSLVEVELKTGRTHQIRVHMQHRLHPLLADDMYQGRVISAGKAGPGIGRVALHAAILKVRHPITDVPMVFHAPLPADLSALLVQLRRGALCDELDPPPAGTMWKLP